MESIIEVKRRYEKELLKLANVVGVGIRYKEVQGKRTDKLSIAVYVSKKLPIEKLDPKDIVPKTLENYPTDVVEVGIIKPLQSRTSRWRPYLGGISIGHYCYDKDTRVMTEDGFKYFFELSPEDRIATLNTKTKELEFQKPLELLRFPYNGELIHIWQKHYDLMVTPNHYLYIKHKRWNDWELLRVDYALQYSKDSLEFLCKANWKGSSLEKVELPKVKKYSRTKIVESIDIKNFMAFLGWYLSDGCTPNDPNDTRIAIDVGMNKDYAVEVEEIIRKMGFHSWNELNGKCIRVVFRSRQLHEYLKQFGHSRQRFIPRWVKDLDKSLLEILFTHLVKGDGHFDSKEGLRKGRPSFYVTASKRLAEDVAEIALKLGLTPKIIKNGKTNCFTVMFSYKETSPRLSNAIISKEPYVGEVYCVTVPNHVILVERNGKLVFSGNSITAGTLGCRVYDVETGRRCILSNNHVLANSDCEDLTRASFNDAILQPGPYDGGTLGDRIAGLYKWVKLKRGGQVNYVDCALALPDNDADLRDDILDIGVPSGVNTNPYLGMPVKKSGRTTGLTTGEITDLYATVQVVYDEPVGTLLFEDQIITTCMSQPGDSGSLLCDENNNAVGLLFAGSSSATVYNKISRVIEALKQAFGFTLKVRVIDKYSRKPVEKIRVKVEKIG
jgi:hypothetical protein